MILMFIRNALDWFQETTKKGFFKLKTVVTTIIIVIFVFVILLWLSIFMYGSFYYSYMPSESFEIPVQLNFRTCDVGAGACSFPTANISLLKTGHEQMFVTGQQYNIALDIDLPESTVNKQLGMFMIKLQLYNKIGESLLTSSRSTMLRHRSELLRIIDTLVFSPLLLSGFAEQKQSFQIEFFTNFIDNPYNPGVGMVVEVQNFHIQLYSVVLKIYAKFTGLRYFLYHWPTFSAVFGITTNLVMLLFITLLSWYRCSSNKKSIDDSYDSYDDIETLEERRKRIKRMIDKEEEDEKTPSSRRIPETDITETIGGGTSHDTESDSLLRHRHVTHKDKHDS